MHTEDTVRDKLLWQLELEENVNNLYQSHQKVT